MISLLRIVIATLLASPSAEAFQLLGAKQQQQFYSSSRTLRVHSALQAERPQQEKQGKHVVVVGGGIGGLATAYDCRHLLSKEDTITVVSARENFEFTPSNPWVAVRKRSPEDISINLRKLLPRHKINFVYGSAAKLDPKKNKLYVRPNYFDEEHDDHQITVDYDYLLIATGPRLAFESVPGLPKHGLSVCTTSHALKAADQYDELIAHPERNIVVGATQGSSCFGPAYEFALLLHAELAKRTPKVERKMTFVTSEPYVGHLGLGGTGESESILTKLLKDRNIDVYTNCFVEKVSASSVTVRQLIQDKEDPTKTIGEKTIKIPSQYTMLIPPFQGHRVWQNVPGLTDAKGMILINDHQQSLKYPNIFAVGVCVHISPLEQTPVPTGVPKTGYLIESMGTAAAKNIKYIIDWQKKNDNADNGDYPETLPHIPLGNALCITDFGDDGAIFLAMPQIPPRRVDVTFHGKLATLAKIAFEKYFLHKIESGDTDPYYEKYMLHLVGVDRTTKTATTTAAAASQSNSGSGPSKQKDTAAGMLR